MLGHQTKTSRHHQEGTWRVCAGVLPSSWVPPREAIWMYLSVFFEELSESVFLPFLVFINVILCVCVCDAPQQFALRKSCQGEKDQGEERELWGEDVRNPHFYYGRRRGGRERKKERKKERRRKKERKKRRKKRKERRKKERKIRRKGKKKRRKQERWEER